MQDKVRMKLKQEEKTFSAAKKSKYEYICFICLSICIINKNEKKEMHVTFELNRLIDLRDDSFYIS